MTATLIIGVFCLLAAWAVWHERHRSDSYTLSVIYTGGFVALGSFVLVVGLCRP